LLEELKDVLSLGDGISGTVKEDQSVVGVLKNGARFTKNKGVSDRGSKRQVLKQATKDVSNNDKDVRGEGVALTEAISAIDPTPRNAI
jgi:hypothetical protein